MNKQQKTMLMEITNFFDNNAITFETSPITSERPTVTITGFVEKKAFMQLIDYLKEITNSGKADVYYNSKIIIMIK